MGYSKSIASVLNMEASLQMLAQQKPCSWDVPEGVTDERAADRLAYKIRQALRIAYRHKTRFPDLAEAYLRFEIQVVGDTLVQAVVKPSKNTSGAIEAGAPIRHGMELAGSAPMVLAMVSSPEEVVKVWHNAQPTNDRIHFPEALLNDAQLKELAAWAASLTPSWMLLRPKGTNALTLAPDDPRVPAEAKVKP